MVNWTTDGVGKDERVGNKLIKTTFKIGKKGRLSIEQTLMRKCPLKRTGVKGNHLQQILDRVSK